ncbi:MAG: OmpA family protein [Saprospiraceae bacterium]|nr:OmpA family protein [Saprospiraceae bacterium]
MTGLIIIITFVLLGIVVLQISRINELAKSIRGEEEAEIRSWNRQSRYLLYFMILFLLGSVITALYYKNYMLGYGPHESASEHGIDLDFLFNVTLVITGIVFIITQIALFYFGYKYRYNPGRKAIFMPHDNKLEIIWTAIPAFAMFALVISGLIVWNDVMGDVGPDDDYLEIEATGTQFQWYIRYPGDDGGLGTRNFRLIKGNNQLGQDWNDIKNLDDFIADDIVLPKGKKVRVRIVARDVLHNFYLPHFRVKMDAVPGMPTYFVFTPTKTTEEYREELSKYPEYQVPADASDPDGLLKWEAFEYELACAELCGYGHYSMRKKVRIVEEGEYRSWLREQNSYYVSTIRGTEDDPYGAQLFDFEIEARKAEFDNAFSTALEAEDIASRTIQLKYVYFETGSAELTSLSQYELNNLVAALLQNPTVVVELGGHTDNTGDAGANQVLSQSRADRVLSYLQGQGVEGSRLRSVGFGQSSPVDSNDTEEGRANNRRTEVRIISK